MSSAPPKSLDYLKPVFDNLRADLRAGLELDEERDSSDIDFYLARRVRGSTKAEAAKTLICDREVLSRWLETRPRHPGHYLVGYLSAADDPRFAARLLATKHAAEPPVRTPSKFVGRLKMTGPGGRKFRRVKGVLIMFDDDKSPTAALAAVPLPQSKAQSYAKSWERAGNLGGDVTFGAIRGKRYVLNGNPNYLLTLEGGTVHVSIDLRGNKFDEAEVVANFSSITIEQ